MKSFVIYVDLEILLTEVRETICCHSLNHWIMIHNAFTVWIRSGSFFCCSAFKEAGLVRIVTFNKLDMRYDRRALIVVVDVLVECIENRMIWGCNIRTADRNHGMLNYDPIWGFSFVFSLMTKISISRISFPYWIDDAVFPHTNMLYFFCSLSPNMV